MHTYHEQEHLYNFSFFVALCSFGRVKWTLTPALKRCGGGLLVVANLTWCGCKGRRSRTLLQPSVLLWAKWSGTSWECACQCGRPCGCTGPSHLVHLCRACSLGSPLRYLHHSSLLCSFSAKTKKKWNEMGSFYVRIQIVCWYIYFWTWTWCLLQKRSWRMGLKHKTTHAINLIAPLKVLSDLNWNSWRPKTSSRSHTFPIFVSTVHRGEQARWSEQMQLTLQKTECVIVMNYVKQKSLTREHSPTADDEKTQRARTITVRDYCCFYYPFGFSYRPMSSLST